MRLTLTVCGHRPGTSAATPPQFRDAEHVALSSSAVRRGVQAVLQVLEAAGAMGGDRERRSADMVVPRKDASPGGPAGVGGTR